MQAKVVPQSRKIDLFFVAATSNRYFNPGVPQLSLSMYPLGISIDEHVPLKLLIAKKVRKITKNVHQ